MFLHFFDRVSENHTRSIMLFTELADSYFGYQRAKFDLGLSVCSLPLLCAKEIIRFIKITDTAFERFQESLQADFEALALQIADTDGMSLAINSGPSKRRWTFKRLAANQSEMGVSKIVYSPFSQPPQQTPSALMVMERYKERKSSNK